jgi:hypothetical protein
MQVSRVQSQLAHEKSKKEEQYIRPLAKTGLSSAPQMLTKTLKHDQHAFPNMLFLCCALCLRVCKSMLYELL